MAQPLDEVLLISYCAAQRGDDWVSVRESASVMFCGAVRNVSEKWTGLVHQSPCQDKSFYLKSIHHSVKWTVDNIIQKRAGGRARLVRLAVEDRFTENHLEEMDVRYFIYKSFKIRFVT